MTVLVDPYSATLPADVEAMAAPAGAGRGGLRPVRALPGLETPESAAVAAAEPAAAAPPLDRWEVETHQYRTEVTANTGFFANLFKGTGKRVTAGVTQEAKLYRLGRSDDGRAVEIGVAVRLAAATSKYDAEAQLSVPNLAASAQLGLADTKIGIYVLGFAGPIGDIMPAPDNLDVENFATYRDAFVEIQKRVFGPDSVRFLSPTVLAYAETPDRGGGAG